MKNMNKNILLTTLALMAPLSVAEDIDANKIGFDKKKSDDTEKVIKNIKYSLPEGMISLEQKSGRLLFNPVLKEVKNKRLNLKFFLPAMVVSQKNGLKVEAETPMVCFVMSAGELGEEEYKNYRQHSTLKYLQDAKSQDISKVLICDVSTTKLNDWRRRLSLDIRTHPFKFEEHTSINDEHFYYYLDADGSFEMYF